MRLPSYLVLLCVALLSSGLGACDYVGPLDICVFPPCGGSGGQEQSYSVTYVTIAADAPRLAQSGGAFSPDTFTTTIGASSVSPVRWVNRDSVAHHLVADSTDLDLFVPPGRDTMFRFRKLGTFDYHCVIHPTMVGTIVVVQ